MLLDYGYGRLSVPGEKGVRTTLIKSTVDRLDHVFSDILPRILGGNPQLEIVHVLVQRQGLPGIREGERMDYLRWLKEKYKPVTWGKAENLRRYKTARGIENGWRELRVLFDVWELMQGEILGLGWKGIDLEEVEGVPDKELAEKWDKWALEADGSMW